MNPALATDVAATLTAYEQRYGAPSGRADFLHSALEAGRSVTRRSDLPIHVTCGAIVRRPDGRLLQIRHRALDCWLFPGGHLEPSDPSLVAAARREIAEETGMDVEHGADGRRVPLDIDVHTIPANEEKGEPEHYHADFRYVLEVDDSAIQLQTDEVTDWRWTDPGSLDNQRLADRLGAL